MLNNKQNPQDEELTPDQLANLARYFRSVVATLELTNDENIPVLDYYCNNNHHQGGWSCRECWTEVQATGEQNNA